MSTPFVHLLLQDDQPYGSERRCCNHCGIMLVKMIAGYVVPPYVESRAEWEAAENNCSEAPL